MNIIAAVDSNWAIGYRNDLLVRIPNDQKWFQKVTTGKVVVMGRKRAFLTAFRSRTVPI